jgi:acylglycerol lipase
VRGSVDDQLTVRASDGIVLRGRSWVPPEAPQRVVLVVHGLKDHSGRYADVAEALNARGGAVVAFDLRGHGRSDGERAFVSRFGVYGTDLDAERAFVTERFPGLPLTILGQSMGGAIVARNALDRPAGLAALALSSPALQPPAATSGAAVFGARLLSALAPHARIFRPDVAGFSRTAEVVQAMAADPLIDQRAIPARTAAELLRTMPTVIADVGRLGPPTWIAHGTADRVTNVEGSQAFARGAPHGRVSLQTIPGGYHDLWHEPEAPRLRTELAEFVVSH